MPDIPTADELFDQYRSEVTARNPALTDFVEGSVLDALGGAGVILADETIKVLLELFAAQFFDTAEDAELDALASDRLGLTRQLAVAAIGPLDFTRSATGSAEIIPLGTIFEGEVNGETVQVTLDADVPMGIGVAAASGTGTAVEAGRSGNVDIGVIDTIPTPVAGIPDLTVTNPERFAGGDEEETDAEFRSRIRRFYTTLRRGTKAALEFGATSVDGVDFATVDESTALGIPGGFVSMYIGDPEGTGNALLVTAVETALEDFRAAGIEVRVFAAAREEIVVALSVSVKQGSDLTTLETAIRAAVIGFMDTLAPRQTLFTSQIASAANNVSSDVLDSDVTIPVGVSLDPTAAKDALRTTDALLTITFIEIPV